MRLGVGQSDSGFTAVRSWWRGVGTQVEKDFIPLASELRTLARSMETLGPTSHGQFQGLFDTEENTEMYATPKKLSHMKIGG